MFCAGITLTSLLDTLGNTGMNSKTSNFGLDLGSGLGSDLDYPDKTTTMNTQKKISMGFNYIIKQKNFSSSLLLTYLESRILVEIICWVSI